MRSQLSEDEKRALDEELSAAFLALGDPSPRAIKDPERVVSLVMDGAQSTSFDDYELVDGGNYGTVFKDWVESEGAALDEDQDRATWRALEALVRAGDAFTTNSAYAGNGGMPAVYWLLHALGKGASGPGGSPSRNGRLLEALKCFCDYAPGASRFWRDLAWSSAWDLFRPLSEASTSPDEEQQRAAELIASMLLQPPTDEIYQNVLADAHSEDRYASGEALAEALVGVLCSPHMDFLRPVVFGPTRWKSGKLWDWFFTAASFRAFFRTPSTRRSLNKALSKSRAFRSGLLAKPELVFTLVEHRERSTLDALLRSDPSTMLALRNARGDGLLHAASRVRAPVHGIVRALLKADFDPQELNTEGESALVIAAREGRKKTLAALQGGLR